MIDREQIENWGDYPCPACGGCGYTTEVDRDGNVWKEDCYCTSHQTKANGETYVPRPKTLPRTGLQTVG